MGGDIICIYITLYIYIYNHIHNLCNRPRVANDCCDLNSSYTRAWGCTNVHSLTIFWYSRSQLLLCIPYPFSFTPLVSSSLHKYIGARPMFLNGSRHPADLRCKLRHYIRLPSYLHRDMVIWTVFEPPLESKIWSKNGSKRDAFNQLWTTSGCGCASVFRMSFSHFNTWISSQSVIRSNSYSLAFSSWHAMTESIESIDKHIWKNI